MLIEARTETGVLVLTPQEARLDASNAATLRETLIAYIDGGRQSLVLDLKGVSFVDSSALGALISALKRMGPLGMLAIAGVQPAVDRLFTLTRMNRVFSMHPGTAEAVSALTEG